jgi:hypothetical protein
MINTSSGISSYCPSGSVLRMLMGRTFAASSATAMSMGLWMLGDTRMNGGAPSASWSDLAPMILALSKRVSCGGPIKIRKVSLFSCSAVFNFFLLTFCCVDTLVRGTDGKTAEKHREYCFCARCSLKPYLGTNWVFARFERNQCINPTNHS